MALQPSLKALQLGNAAAPHTLEVYIDGTCPFSKKQILGLRDHVVPQLSSGQFKLIIRPYIQPWHWTSVLLGEALLAIAHLASNNSAEKLANPSTNAFWLFCIELMNQQERFYEAPARSRAADEIRSDLTSIAVGLFGGGGHGQGASTGEIQDGLLRADEKGVPLGQAIKDLLRVSKDGNAGNAVGPDIKYCTRLGRQNGIHVTPTCLWNGLVDGSISSGFGEKEWKEYLEKQLAA